VSRSTNPIDHPDDEVLADLAMRVLPGNDARRALDHMASCPECETRFQRIAADWEQSAARAGELSGRTIRDIVARPSPSLADVLRRPVMRWAIGAAAVVVAALILLPIRTNGPETPGPTRLPLLTHDVLPRSVLPTDQNDALLEGLDAYARDDFRGAIDALQAVETTGPVEALRRVYLASAFVFEGQCDEAIEILEGVPLDAVPDPWSAEALWTQYIALSDCGRATDAERVLRDLAVYPGEPGERARSIIERQR
jgi:hypothetical protein